MTHDRYKLIPDEFHVDGAGRKFPVVLRRPAEPVQLVIFHGRSSVEHFGGGGRRVTLDCPKSRFFAPSPCPRRGFADRLDPLAYEGVPYVDASVLRSLHLGAPPLDEGVALYVDFWRDAGAEIGYIRAGRFVPST